MSESLSFLPIGWNAVTAFSTIAIALFGFFINRRLRSDAEKAAKYAILVEYRKQIISYSEDFFALTAAAIAICENKSASIVDNDAYKIAADISSHLDKGRFIFPNYLHGDSFGVQKGKAFEGYRREPLDAVLAAYFATKSLIDGEEKEKNLRMSHRELIRAAQPISGKFNPHVTKSLIVESRRSFLNAVVPTTFPQEWRAQFYELYGPANMLDDQAIDREVDRHRAASQLGST